MKPVLTTIGADSPELLYFPIFTAEGGFVAAQTGEVPGLEDTTLMASDGVFSADFINAAGPNAEGMYLSSPDFTAFGDAYQGFLQKYQAKFGSAPIQIFHAHAYDGANILFNAIEKVAVRTGDTIHIPKGALRQAVYDTEGHQGLTGTLSCGDSGDCSDPVIGIYQVTAREIGGEWPPEAPIWTPEEGGGDGASPSASP
jgi:branched-chain amino acid transport system substrate-binding protein